MNLKSSALRMTGKIRLLLIAMAMALALTGCVTPNFQPVTTVPEDKALVYFYRKAHISGARGTHRLYVNGEFVGLLPNGGYFPYFATPGTNLVSSSFANTVTLFGAPLPMSLLDESHLFSLTAEAGQTYYLQFKIATTWGPKMVQMDSKAGAREIEKCRLAPSFQHTREVPERWNFAFDSRPWQLVYQAANRQNATREYVLIGQTVHDWSELVSSYYAAGEIPLRAFFEEFRRGLAHDCPSLRVSIIEETADSILFEWRHTGCQGQPAQHEIRRIESVEAGTLMLSFVEKTRELSAEKRATWLAIIKAASVQQDE